MRKPQKPRRLLVLELDEKEGLLDEETTLELNVLRNDYEGACYDWADRENDSARDRKLTETE
jgi:hypothetical protein